LKDVPRIGLEGIVVDVAAIIDGPYEATSCAELELIPGIGHDGAAGIDDIRMYIEHLIQAGREAGSLWSQPDGNGLPGGAKLVASNLMAARVTDGGKRAGFERNLP